MTEKRLIDFKEGLRYRIEHAERKTARLKKIYALLSNFTFNEKDLRLLEKEISEILGTSD